MDNKCPSCSAKIDFNPVTQSWDCSSCGLTFTPEQMLSFNNNNVQSNPASQPNNQMVQPQINSQPLTQNMSPQTVQTPVAPQPVAPQPVSQQNVSIPTPVASPLEKETKMRNFDQYHCNNCGVEVMTDANTISNFCVYCGSPSLQKDRVDEAKAPNLIIPFKKSKSEAAKSFAKLMKNKPLTPRVFRNIKNLNKIIGLYVPYWAYDITCDGNISFHCADAEKWMDENYRYIKTSKFDTTMFAHLDYQKVLSKASTHFKEELMSSLEPYNFDELVDFNHAYLSGCYAEKYDITEEDAYVSANEYTMNQCVDMSKKEVGHQVCEVNQNNLYLSKKSTNCIMLPVYMVQVKYKDRDYTFVMNGQTGKVDGNLPVGLLETIICTILVFVVLVGVAYLFSILGR